MGYEQILKVIPTIQSASLVSHNVGFLKKKKKKTKDFVSYGVDNIVGTALIQENSKFLYG